MPKKRPENSLALRRLLFAVMPCIIFFMGCAPSGQWPVASTSGEVNDSVMMSQWPGDEKATPEILEALDYKMIPLAWESKRYPHRSLWSLYLQFQIVTKWLPHLDIAQDMISFCPKYDSLNKHQKANVWAQLFVGISKFESDWNPRKRYLETTMGIDPVTQETVQSEGLLQLSYQDAGWAKYCRFDWQTDKELEVTDANKTIFSPYRNLNCGLGLMSRQIKKKGRIIVGDGAYWSTIRSDGKFEHIAEIAELVSKLPICK